MFRSVIGLGVVAGLFALGAASTFAIAPMPEWPSSSETVIDVTTKDSTTVGTATFKVDGADLEVAIETEDGWVIEEIHFHVAASLSGIPQTKKGNPIPGQFLMKADGDGETDHAFSVSLADLELSADDGLVVAVHVVVSKDVDGKTEKEAAWVGDSWFPGKSKARYAVLD
jgi:hypothetical protein